MPFKLSVMKDKIYKVEQLKENIPDDEDVYEDDKLWRKAFNGDFDRYVCLEVSDDFGYDLTLVLHLDDPDVNYFKREDIEHLFG